VQLSVPSLVQFLCNLGAFYGEMGAHLVEMHSEGAVRCVVGEHLNPAERYSALLTDGLEQRQGDQPSVDYDVREKEETETVQASLI
jgi:hypothetical protein